MNYIVVIVDDPAKGIVDGNLIVHEGNGTPCKHLRGDKPGEYSCSVHDEPWFKDTPCHDFAQIEESPDRPCRVGNYLLNNLR